MLSHIEVLVQISTLTFLGFICIFKPASSIFINYLILWIQQCIFVSNQSSHHFFVDYWHHLGLCWSINHHNFVLLWVVHSNICPLFYYLIFRAFMFNAFFSSFCSIMCHFGIFLYNFFLYFQKFYFVFNIYFKC